MKKVGKILQVAVLLILVGITFLWWRNKITQEEQAQDITLQLNQLKGVAKLVIWEQSFTLNNTQSIERTYIGIFKSKESISTTIQGEAGFHIDLTDSINTHFNRYGDTILIQAPLQNTYIALDLGTLNQVKEASIDPTLELKKEEVIKSLQRKALEEFTPNLKKNLPLKNLKYQEEKLSQLIGMPVKIEITQYPHSSQFNWKGWKLE